MPQSAFRLVPRYLIRRILADRSGHGWAGCLHSVLDGQFDVDRLDFLCRDSAGAGTEFGHLDVTNLLRNLELHRTGPHDWRIALGAQALSSFETMLLQRAQHYRWVVQHHMVVAADAAVQRAITALFSMSSGAEPVPALRDLVPDLDYLTSASAGGGGGACVDDPGVLSWLRAARPVLTSMAIEESPAGEQARATLALIRMVGSMSITPIPAWRDYHEFVARIEQLGELSPLAVALAAMEVMRPTYFAFFVPHDGEPTEPSRDQRRELGAVFLREMLNVVRLATSGVGP